MTRQWAILGFVMGLLFVTAVLMAVGRAHAAPPGPDVDHQTEPSLQMQPDRILPKLSLA